MKRVKVIPVDFLSDGQPADPQRFQMAAAFAEEQLGEAPLPKFAKLWLAIEEDDAGMPQKVLGLAGLVWRLDVPVFHVAKPVEGAEWAEWKECLEARDLLAQRVMNWVADNGGRGYPVFVYVAPEAQEQWKSFLEKIKAVPANRWEFEI